jgi:hypothetical protein
VKIDFRRLDEEDLPLLHEWLQRDHVTRWWDKHQTYEEVASHYLPAISGTDPTDLYVIELDGHAAGFIQTISSRTTRSTRRSWMPASRSRASTSFSQTPAIPTTSILCTC